MQEFTDKYNFKVELEQIASRNDGLMGGMARNSRHYECTITHDADAFGKGHNLGDSHSILYSCGPACDEPTICDILGCLVSDSLNVEDADDFEEWAEMAGYDTDSRKAESVYKACVDQQSNLKNSMADSLYYELMQEVEQD
jgi:hypothetical protein